MDPASLSLLGTAISAAVAAIAYVAKTRHERRRATRVVLYYLLEVHHLVHRISLMDGGYQNLFLGLLREALERRNIRLTPSDLKQYQDEFPLFVEAFARNETHDLSESIAEPFGKALADLSREDPVLAFKLRGRDKLLVLSQRLTGAYQSVSERGGEVPKEDKQPPLAPHEDLLRKLTADELRLATLETARRCDVLTYIRVRLLLRAALRERTDDYISDQLKPLVAQLVDRVAPR